MDSEGELRNETIILVNDDNHPIQRKLHVPNLT